MSQLRLIQTAVQEDTPQAYYERHHKFNVDVLGFKLEYVLAPQTVLDHYHGATRLGFRDDEGNVLVSKNLNPAQIPFVALLNYIHGMEKEELEEKIGKGTFAGLSDSQIKGLVTKIVFEQAAKILRPNDTAELIQLYRGDRRYEPTRDELTFSQIGFNYNSDAIVPLSTDSLEHYVKHDKEYAQSHHDNKWVKQSREMTQLMKDNPSLKSVFGDYVTKVDPVITDILSDSRLADSIVPITNSITKLAEARKGDVIQVDSLGARVLYLLQSSIDNPPFEFITVYNLSKNVIRITNGRASKLFEALKCRLSYQLFNDLSDRERALEGVKEVVTAIPGNQTLKQIAENYLVSKGQLPTQADIAQLPSKYLEEVLEGTIRDENTIIKEAATAMPPYYHQYSAAKRAQRALSEAGLDTSSVDALVLKLKNDISEDFIKQAHLRQISS